VFHANLARRKRLTSTLPNVSSKWRHPEHHRATPASSAAATAPSSQGDPTAGGCHSSPVAAIANPVRHGWQNKQQHGIVSLFGQPTGADGQRFPRAVTANYRVEDVDAFCFDCGHHELGCVLHFG